MRHALVLSIVLALTVAGCGDTSPSPAGTPTPTASPTPAATPSSPGTEPTDAPSTRAPSEALPGDPWDGPPVGGTPGVLAVIGVAADDVLNVRATPGADQEVIAALAPLAMEVAASGRSRSLPDVWVEVAVDGRSGWVSSRYVAFPGPTDDITSQVVAAAGTYPNAETMLDLGLAVAALRASEDPPSDVVVSAGPSVGDLGEVTVDVVGLGDDAVRAERLVVFGAPDESGEGFTLMSVEATTFCGRGPAEADGACP